MILTYKVKHGRVFSEELQKAKKIANYAIRTKSRTTRDVRHLGLKAIIANQILKKYGRKGTRTAKSVKITIPGQGIKFDRTTRTVHISCLDLNLDCTYMPDFDAIRQVEIGKEFAYCSVEFKEPGTKPAEKFIGVDCNTTGHVAVVAVPYTGKIHKLGKEALHIRKKYMSIRKRLQKQGKYSLLRQIRSRESNILTNLDHHISKKLVDIATSEQSGIRFEKLKGIRSNKKHHKKFRYSLNSWSYYRLQKFTEYKAKKEGIEVAYVAPAYTSKSCSRCGSLGYRDDKKFACVRCGHADHADVNAAFNIGKPVSHCAIVPAVRIVPRAQDMSRLDAESDAFKGSTDTPQAAIARMVQTVEPLPLGFGVCQG